MLFRECCAGVLFFSLTAERVVINQVPIIGPNASAPAVQRVPFLLDWDPGASNATRHVILKRAPYGVVRFRTIASRLGRLSDQFLPDRLVKVHARLQLTTLQLRTDQLFDAILVVCDQL